MKLIIQKPYKAINKAYLKEKVNRSAIERFKANLTSLLAKIDEKESEEHLKNLVTEFLKDTWYKDLHEINTKGRNDLVIHTGKATKDSVGVILEVKKPSNKSEMVSVLKPNVKGFQELVLYYLRERCEHNNIDIKYLIATNIYEWFIIDEVWFEKNVFRNTKLKKDYENWKISGNDTRFFYENIAKPFLETVEETINCTFFDIREFKTVIDGSVKTEDNKLISLYKIFSPPHLLKQPFTNDSNSLDTKFYTELLHIIGLEEKKDGSKRLIKRKVKPDSASLIENAIMKLEDNDCLRTLSNKTSYGEDKKEQYFNVALELCITWVNRVLFMKLLEAQLSKYHKNNKEYLFLNKETVVDFHALNDLFFLVLAEKSSSRRPHLKEKYKSVPYLNSSLFEKTPLEKETIEVSNLDPRLELAVHKETVLKDLKGKKLIGSQLALHYFFNFLSSYDFSSEGSEEIQEENKNLINASVLGLIFEKINGYKDGSFFTPGYVTMYISKEAIRKSVLLKFNTIKGWNVQTFEELYDKIENKKEANEIINDLKICDPAVGSGHFLVSALNEIISLKSELKILLDDDFKTLRDYTFEVVNDELIITNEDGALFEYNPKIKESQRVQETLFHEKEKIIENSLFGVDINPNSVKICRLRLWIELLKHAYYTKETGFAELETLPNIDINIKSGNSLISRFQIDDDLKSAFKKSKYKFKDYTESVASYKTTNSKDEKIKLMSIIEQIRNDFTSTIDEKLKARLARFRGSLTNIETEINSKKQWGDEVPKELIESLKKAKEKLRKSEAARDNILNNVIYKNSFEWRFEFPEVLDSDGNFKGFDLIIGNPPYGVSLKNDLRDAIVSAYGKVPDYEIYYYFIEIGKFILKQNTGLLSLIIPNTILFNMFAKEYREGLFEDWKVDEVLDCTNFNVFDDATVNNVIISLQRSENTTKISYRPTENISSFQNLISQNRITIDKETLLLNNQNWGLVFKLPTKVLNLTSKIRSNKKQLIDYFPELSQGLIAYDKYQGQSKETIKKRIYHSFVKKDDSFKPWLYGEDVTRYKVEWNKKEFIKYGKGVANPREPKYFNGKRILIREITNPRIFAAYTEKELYNDPAILIVKDSPDSPITLVTLLSIINSRLGTFYHFNSSPKATKGAFPKILVEDIRIFPLPEYDEVTSSNYDELNDLASEIIIKKSDYKTHDEQIDKLVYALFNLSERDIKIIDERLSQLK